MAGIITISPGHDASYPGGRSVRRPVADTPIGRVPGTTCRHRRRAASRRAGSDEEHMQEAADRGESARVEPSELTAGPLSGQGADLLGHGIGGPLKPGGRVSGDFDMVGQAAVSRGQRYGEEQSGNDRIARV